ncbi:hypothetical protein [Streptomyces tsukubensis]|uniref:Uncharacterized protein n=1 Tax=Streptomyces tsukubensis TaxID=83656 RepID=A0A1V4AA19_9ACTN|nr:hypothetical protein [Streptomyces tsukubensis]OON80154.1 hypothetical protein B1H18_13365 [Streptomyces tsukubensis]QFR97383.1 hypothetical protein GBW32_35325 [Streptomyces tsukubensis]
MNTELIVASLSGVVALGSAWFTARSGRRQAVLAHELESRTAQQDLMGRHRDPLLWAAYDLQSRLYNIVDRGFLHVYLHEGSDRQRAYARRSTLHVLGEYLGRVEILRRGIQFLDLGDSTLNRRIVGHFTAISNVLNNDGGGNPRFADQYFVIFRSDQRAIGELMLTDDGTSCLGYVEFCRRLEADPEFTEWFGPLAVSIEELSRAEEPPYRLVALQQALMDLIDLLDPRAERFPDHRRSRLGRPPGM